MATKKPKVVDPDDIDLLGSAKDAKLVRAYAAQAGIDAAPFLERAYHEGNVAIRVAAVASLVDVAPRVAEGMVVADLPSSTPGTPKKVLGALLSAAVALGTDAALDAALSTLARPGARWVGDVTDEQELRLCARALSAEPKVVAELVDRFALATRCGFAPPGDARRALRRLLVPYLDGADVALRIAFARVLGAWGEPEDLSALRPHVAWLDPQKAVAAAFAEPATAFERLAARFHTDRALRGHVVTTLQHGPRADGSPAAADRRWAPLLLDVLGDDAVGVGAALAQVLRDDVVTVLAARFDAATGDARVAVARALASLRTSNPGARAALLDRAALLPLELEAEVRLEADPRAAFDALAPRIDSDAALRAAVCRHLRGGADHRWGSRLAPYAESEPSAVVDALLRMQDVDTLLAFAHRAVLDALTKHALHALGQAGEQRVAPVLLAWLARTDGEAVAPMLLAALGRCGSPDDVAHISALPRSEERAGFYAACTAAIAERGGKLTTSLTTVA